MSAAYITAREVMDRSAVLLNDPSMTDYNYVVLTPFLRMAVDEMVESMIDSQSAPTLMGSFTVDLPPGTNAIYPSESVQSVTYPTQLVEIQELRVKRAGTTDDHIPMKRREFMPSSSTALNGLFTEWSWEVQTIILHRAGSAVHQEVQIYGLIDVSGPITSPDTIIAGSKSRSFLSYKTAAYAAMFIGENSERAAALDEKAEEAMDRIDSINNKSRQQIMTRHRPFRAAWKARGGF